MTPKELARELRSGPITQVDLEQAADLLDRIDALEAVAKAAEMGRTAIVDIASCRVCKGGMELGYQTHHRDCSPDPDDEPVDLDPIAQAAFDALDSSLRALKEVPRGE